MTSVLYTCPLGGEECGRLFASPGGTSIHCTKHPEETLQQVEFFGGADSLYVDESGHTKSRGHIVTQGVQSTPNQSLKTAPPPTDTVPEEQILNDLRAEYELVSGYKADKRWKESRLREEIAWEQEQAMGSNPLDGKGAVESAPEPVITDTEETPEGNKDDV